MFDVYGKTQFLQDSTFCLDHLVFQLDVILVEYHRCYSSAQIVKTHTEISCEKILPYFVHNFAIKPNFPIEYAKKIYVDKI